MKVTQLTICSNFDRLILIIAYLVSQGDEIDKKALFTFDLTAETDYARLGENAVIIDLQNLNIIVRFKNVNGKHLYYNNMYAKLIQIKIRLVQMLDNSVIKCQFFEATMLRLYFQIEQKKHQRLNIFNFMVISVNSKI